MELSIALYCYAFKFSHLFLLKNQFLIRQLQFNLFTRALLVISTLKHKPLLRNHALCITTHVVFLVHCYTRKFSCYHSIPKIRMVILANIA